MPLLNRSKDFEGLMCMTMFEGRKPKIEALSTKEVLAIYQVLVEENPGVGQPVGPDDEAHALESALQARGKQVDLLPLPSWAGSVAPETARALLLLVAEAPTRVPAGMRNLGQELDDLLETPPSAGSGAIPIMLAAPMVLTGCILALQASARASFGLRDGKWYFDYDPTREGPLDKVMDNIVKTLAGLMKPPTPGI